MEWISVEDRLPELGYYLILTDGDIQTANFSNNFGTRWYGYFGMSENDMGMSCTIEFKEVTHWMPLPSPPKQQ